MKSNLIENRHIRVFISSTFRDMQDERDYLMKRVFPKLRALGEQRDVTVTEVDLRWGITEEESRTGQVVDICFKEIENSIPFFIGIIGNRYGWVPTEHDLGGDVTKHFPDVDRYIDEHLSVTEMEMQFGVLERKDENLYAYFYLKNELGEEDNHAMLDRLRTAVRKSSYPSTQYATPEELAEKVEKDFINLLDHLYPEKLLSEKDKIQMAKQSHVNSMCKLYIRNEKIEHEITQWILSPQVPQVLLIRGPQGIGKSTVIANWLNENKSVHDYSFVTCFVGYPYTDIDDIREQLAKDIAKECGIDNDRLEEVVQHIPADKRLLIVVDDLDELTSRKRGEENSICRLLIDGEIPANVRLLFTISDTEGIHTDTENVAGYDSMQRINMTYLSQEERVGFIRTYLGFFSKKMTEKQVETIAANKLCHNTMALRVALDELITYGDFETLDDKIATFLPPSKDEKSFLWQLYSINNNDRYRPIYISCVIISGLKKTFGDYVEDVLCLIGMTKSGLTENEIIKITGITRLQWSYIYYNLLPQLMIDNGRIRFKNFCFYQAIRELYLRNMNHTALRQKLLDYLKNSSNKILIKEIPDFCSDQCSELDYLPDSLGQKIDLHKLAINILEKHGDIWNLSREYKSLGNLYRQAGDYDEAISAIGKARELYLTDKKYIEYLAYIKIDMSDLYAEQGNYQKALAIALEAKEDMKDFLAANAPGIIDMDVKIGRLYHNLKDLDKALSYIKNAIIAKMEALGVSENEQESALLFDKEYRILSAIYYDMGNDEMGEKYFKLANT